MPAELLSFPCPYCGQQQLLHADDHPVSGEFACKSCGEQIAFEAPGQPVRLVRSDQADAGRGERQKFSATDSLLRIEEFSEVADRLDPPKIECPKCGHEFEPATGPNDRRVVLIVEDNEFFLQLAVEVLSTEFETKGVTTAAEARQILESQPVDLVVLDLTLEDAEGTDVLEALPQPGVPVLIYTSREENDLLGDEWTKLRSMGATDVIHKGLNIEEQLMKKVVDLLAGSPGRVQMESGRGG